MNSLFIKRTMILLMVATLAVITLTVAPTRAQEKETLNVYIDSDTNISDWWLKTIIPKFTEKYPQYQVIVSITRGAGNNEMIVQRVKAAMESGADPQVDFFEIYETFNHPDLEEAGLFLKIDETTVPNSKNIIKAAYRSDYNIPYRGSQVLLAYNSDKIPENEVPRTFADLVTWIKAHPGQFVYCRPDKGGSGGHFVSRAIYEANGQDPSMFKAETFDEAKVKEQYAKAWEILKDIGPSVYDNGAYPAGNTAVLKLLANESVSLVTAWSDQAIQGIATGVLPETTKLVQLTDLPFPGGYSYSAIPANSKHLEGAKLLANFLLSEEIQSSVVKDIGGFPAVSWDQLPQELQQQFNSVITDTVPSWPGGKFDTLKNEGWYKEVAPNIDPKS